MEHTLPHALEPGEQADNQVIGAEDLDLGAEGWSPEWHLGFSLDAPNTQYLTRTIW